MNYQAKIEEIALYLGHPWKFNRLNGFSKYHWSVIDGSGRGLSFYLRGDNLTVFGNFPPNKTLSLQKNYKTIGVSVSRPAKAIAADIEKRLIPHYRNAFERAKAEHARQEKERETLQQIVDVLVKFSGGRDLRPARMPRTVSFDNGRVNLWSDHKINLELRKVSIDQVFQIIAILQNKK